MLGQRMHLFALIVVTFGIRAALGAGAEEVQQASPKFLRLSRDDDGKLVSMDTAIVTYRPRAGGDLRVDLIGAIHIGEREYYETLNKEFEQYDVVLYELVAPKGTRIPKGGAGRTAHPVNLLQAGMQQMLELESQVELIDYEKANLLHADMSPEDFSKSMDDRGDNFFAMFFRMLGRGIAQQSRQQALAQSGQRARGANDAELLMAMFDPKRSHKLKQLMAEQFEDLEGMMSVFEGPDGSTLISERNKVALQALREQIDAGKTKIAIFYGAGHLPDMEKRLLSDFDLRRQGERWCVAWRLSEKTSAPKHQAKD